MTKRGLNIEETSNNKKPKLNNDIDDLWDDDELDESIFDNCIKIASQALEEDDEKNESFLPSYEGFKAPKAIVTSTQFNDSIGPTTSNSNAFDINMNTLKLQCEEKDGEIAVLRSQLKEVKLQSNLEYIKGRSEMKHKLSLTNKELHSIKSELEFKNLEIANLKQKINSTKHFINMTIFNETKMSPKPSTSKGKIWQPKNISRRKMYPLVNTDYPLKNMFTEFVVTFSEPEKFVIDNKLTHTFKNSIPYLQNKNVSTRIILSKNTANVQNVYPKMLQLCEKSSEEIKSIKNVLPINEIVSTCLQCLEDFSDLLREIKKSLRNEDVLEADSHYLENTDLTDCDPSNELGTKLSFILNFLSVLLLYSEYLQDYLIKNKPLDLRDQKDFIKTIPCFSAKKIHNGEVFLNKIISVVKLGGEIRKSMVMSLFLISTIKLFTNICKINGYDNLSYFICRFTKELILCRPLQSVTFELTYLLREGSKNTGFVQFLLNKSKNCCSIKKNILYFNEDACRFYIFVVIFDRSMSKNKTVPMEICLNMLTFIYNSYKSSYFLHHLNIKECECLPQLYKLQIELIFRMLEKYTDDITVRKVTSNWTDLFNNKIILKVLNLMAFHCYELTEKYITVYSQFKEIERRLNEAGVSDLDRLNVNEDIPEIDHTKFENIGF